MNYSAEPQFKRKHVSSRFELGIIRWLNHFDRKKLSFLIGIFTVVALAVFCYKVVLRNQGKAVSVNISTPVEISGYCNRDALYSAVNFLGNHGADKHNPTLYTQLLSTAKVQTIPAVSWSDDFNQIDPLSGSNTGQWVVSYDDYTRANDVNYVTNVLKKKIIDSLLANRPVIIGNGLYRKNPVSKHPGHFYFITSFDANTGIFGLMDGVRMANRKFNLKSIGKGDGSLTSILQLGANANLDYNGTSGHSVIIFFQPVWYYTSASDPNRTLAAVPANASPSVDMTTFLDSSIDPPSGATWGSGGTDGWQGDLNAWSLNGTQPTNGKVTLAATAPLRNWAGVITRTYSCPPSCLATGTLSLTVAPSPADTYQWRSVSVDADIPLGTRAVLSSVSNGVTSTSGNLTNLPASQSITFTLTLKSNQSLNSTPTIRSINLNYDTIVDAPDGVPTPTAVPTATARPTATATARPTATATATARPTATATARPTATATATARPTATATARPTATAAPTATATAAPTLTTHLPISLTIGEPGQNSTFHYNTVYSVSFTAQDPNVGGKLTTAYVYFNLKFSGNWWTLNKLLYTLTFPNTCVPNAPCSLSASFSLPSGVNPAFDNSSQFSALVRVNDQFNVNAVGSTATAYVVIPAVN